MSDRLDFEKVFPPPSGVIWLEDATGIYRFKFEGQYVAAKANTHRNQRRNSLRAEAQNRAYEVWRYRSDEIKELKYQLKMMELSKSK